MKSILTLLSSAALASACLVAPAHADSTQFVVLALATGNSLLQTGSFADTVAAAGSFTDDFVFAVPPPNATVSFTATAGSGIQFSSVQLKVYGGTTTAALTGTQTATAINESTFSSLISGVYEIEIKGVALAGSSSYAGTISVLTGSQAPVPEPASWALMALGLTAVGAAAGARRRRQPASVRAR